MRVRVRERRREGEMQSKKDKEKDRDGWMKEIQILGLFQAILVILKEPLHEV